ncbi:MAG: aminotransferase class I/II-fold pyridoxal phosphate-dependent enzyme [Anaerolineae bacterium]|nr:aminotransferase class I/II-fold pyridoxal phosphate-dependent enzyme [Anaerolineae bacterium]
MQVPLVDLARQHQEIALEVWDGLGEVFETSAFIRGPQVAEFEAEFAAFVGANHCIGVGNGTDALEMALRASGIGHGDEVVVPANTFIASALAVLRAGASVKLVDCDPENYLIDVEAVATAMTHRVRAVMPVHIYGQMAKMDELVEVVGEAVIIEDAAQSQGATRLGKGIGAVSAAAGTSFYPGKNIGAYGDAGAVLTNDDSLADAVRRLGNWGSDRKYHHPQIGFNSRLDTVQAVVLRAKLARLSKWNEQRRAAAERYHKMLSDVEGVSPPVTAAGNVHVWHLYVVRVPDRDRVLGDLRASGVGAGVHYPRPVHLHGAMSDLGYGVGNFPVAEAVSREVLSLPLFPGITEFEQGYVVDKLKVALSKKVSSG